MKTGNRAEQKLERRNKISRKRLILNFGANAALRFIRGDEIEIFIKTSNQTKNIYILV